MSLSSYSDLNEMQLDVLREIGNIGTGNAATSLASMLAKPVDIKVPTISVLDFQEVADALGGPESMVVGLLLTMEGDVNGMLMFLLEKDFAHLTLNTLIGSTLKDFSEIDEMGISAIKEVSNIMAASYVNTISEMTNLVIQISVPEISIDMVGAIMSVPAIHYANISDKIIFIEDQFISGEEEAISHILMIPDVDSLKAIMTNLGIEI